MFPSKLIVITLGGLFAIGIVGFGALTFLADTDNAQPVGAASVQWAICTYTQDSQDVNRLACVDKLSPEDSNTTLMSFMQSFYVNDKTTLDTVRQSMREFEPPTPDIVEADCPAPNCNPIARITYHIKVRDPEPTKVTFVFDDDAILTDLTMSR